MLEGLDRPAALLQWLNRSGVRWTIQRADVARSGATYIGRYATAAEDCVHQAGSGREWSDKPPVVASCTLIRLCEELCMTALQQNMPEHHCSLGVRQQLDHLGPVAVGAEIEITARCIDDRGRYSSWHIVIRDAHETVGEGLMDFVVVHRSDYEARRLLPKHAALALNARGVLKPSPGLHLQNLPASELRRKVKPVRRARL